jgi:hypothetical protein
MTTLTDAERAELVRAAIAFHRACSGPMASIRTDAPDYPLLRDVALAISTAVGLLTGDPTPWTKSRTSPPE